MDFIQIAQQYGIALAALTVVGAALGMVARTLFKELKARIERAEQQVDTIVPSLDRLSTAIETQTKTTQDVLSTLIQQREGK